ncbi:MAG: class I SAM-dependent methyltransferase [Caulobacteraceae bacterium]
MAFCVRTDEAEAVSGQFLRCQECGSLYPNRFPGDHELAGYYAGYYTGRAPKVGWRSIPRAVLAFLRRNYLARGVPPGARKVLDYGCGSGAFLARLGVARRDCAAFGSDLTPPSHVGPWRWIERAELGAAAPYDWITLSHVIEHVPDPAEVLGGLADHVGPDGGIWISTPNADSFLFGAAGRWARDVDFPRHRIVFSREGLERMARACGLAVAFRGAPRTNAALNAAATLSNIIRDRSASLWTKLTVAAGVCGGLAAHCLQGRAARDATSPELIALCFPTGGRVTSPLDPMATAP